MNIGVIGYKGRLGSQLVAMGCEPIDYDITSKKYLPIKYKPDLIINCAAKTQVDLAEDDRYYWEFIEVNGYGTQNLANVCPVDIIHISTDYVFQGKRGPYGEKSEFNDNDVPTKKMPYGISKFLSELLARDNPNVYIVRTTGLYGGVSGRNDFLKTILNSEGELKISKELRGNQTYIPHLAEAIIKYAEMENRPKLIHLASKEVVSRYEFALMVASVYGLDKSRFIPCKNSEVPGWISERPKKGGLKVGLAEKLGLPIYTILEGLEESKNE